ncbi:MAG TPA: protein adenylyltransferase SelO family protein, partial [Methylococcales bacterium]
GPYGWLENYDPNWTPNTTDADERRYRFGNQPQIAFWNLGQLANAIYPLVEQVEPFQQALAVYTETFEQGWQTMMAGKLGLNTFDPATDDELCTELLTLLQWVETDMTIFYRQLAMIDIDVEMQCEDMINCISAAYYIPTQITPDYKSRLCLWFSRYIKRVKNDGTPDNIRQQRMNAVNPKYVLRNYLAQLAIDKAEQGDFSMVNELLELLRHPYDEQPGKEEFAVKRPDWARQRAGCSMLSCSS